MTTRADLVDTLASRGVTARAAGGNHDILESLVLAGLLDKPTCGGAAGDARLASNLIVGAVNALGDANDIATANDAALAAAAAQGGPSAPGRPEPAHAGAALLATFLEELEQ
jgi:hypothetical protein